LPDIRRVSRLLFGCFPCARSRFNHFHENLSAVWRILRKTDRFLSAGACLSKPRRDKRGVTSRRSYYRVKVDDDSGHRFGFREQDLEILFGRPSLDNVARPQGELAW
jgi:hypothetical protein